MNLEAAGLLNIKDEESILVQFINDKGKRTGVGFEAWIKSEIEDVNQFTGQSLEVYWPKVDITPAKTLKRILQKGCIWEIHVVKLLSNGGKCKDIISPALCLLSVMVAYGLIYLLTKCSKNKNKYPFSKLHTGAGSAVIYKP